MGTLVITAIYIVVLLGLAMEALAEYRDSHLSARYGLRARHR